MSEVWSDAICDDVIAATCAVVNPVTQLILPPQSDCLCLLDCPYCVDHPHYFCTALQPQFLLLPLTADAPQGGYIFSNFRRHLESEYERPLERFLSGSPESMAETINSLATTVEESLQSSMRFPSCANPKTVLLSVFG